MRYPCSFCIFGCPFYRSNPEMNYMRGLQVQNPMEVQMKEIRYTKDYLYVDVKIPVLKGIKDQKIQDSINGSIENDIMEFLRQMEVAAQEGAKQAQQQGRVFQPYVISTIYTVSYNENSIVSISVIYHEYLEGKHSYIKTSYNYDITTGQSLGLRELFKEGVNYRELINQEIRKELMLHKERYLPDALERFKGIAEDQPFYLENRNLVIYFGFHQIAPIASEIPVIRLPLSAFQNVIRPTFLRA